MEFNAVGSGTYVRRDSVLSRQGSKVSVKKRSHAEIENLKKELTTKDHLLTLSDLCRRLGTNMSTGLTQAQAKELLDLNGPNVLQPSAPKSKFIIFLKTMFCGFSSLLWAGTILSYVGFTIEYVEHPEKKNFDHLYIGSSLALVVIITGLLSFVEEARNCSIMEGFVKMVPKFATVLREGKIQVILAEEIVLGDIVVISSGDSIPADLRIIEATSMKVDNSSLTGESEPQPRSTDCTDKSPMETQNLAFFGTFVTEGSGRGIVVSCGDDTFMGHIAGLTSGLEAEITPMQKELHKFIKIITCFASVIGLLFFILSLMMGTTILAALIFFIAIVVANVPEGLLVTLTVGLTLTAQRMAKKKCLVKNLNGIETLGSTNVICSDKTGTLTQNRMTVAHMFYEGAIYDVLEEWNDSRLNEPGFKAISRVGMLCSRTEFKPGQENVSVVLREAMGDASEIAVLKCMELRVGNVMEYRRHHPKLAEIPFNSTNKYQVSIHKLENSTCLLVMKGAPERILERCSTIAEKGNSKVNITSEQKSKINKTISDMAAMGERVLGFADLRLDSGTYNTSYKYDTQKVNFPVTGLRFCGLMSMLDPPKHGVPEAVEKCKSAGIKVFMVTGDHPITAMAIARKVGIISKNHITAYDIAIKRNISISHVPKADVATCNAGILTGTDLKQMDQEALKRYVQQYEEIVFARTSPQQKLKIVECLQSMENIVAVTGDGVNDSPALKKADIGVAMGISGSAVSKEAADMIIMDDNFTTIVTGIEEGRLVFDNLKKSIAFILTSNVPEILPFITYATANIPPVLSVMGILVINVGTDLWPGIALAYEKSERDIMNQKPRNPKVDSLVNSRLYIFVWQIGIIQACAGFSCYFFTLAVHGFFFNRIFGLRKEWESKHINDLEDSYGQQWTYTERQHLSRKCYSAYFMAIVITQVVDAIICKTRRLSLFTQGMTNWCLNAGLLFEICLAGVAVYCPYVNKFLQFAPIEWYLLVPALPFACIIFIFDEVRKLLIRRHPGTCPEKETYY